MSIKVEEKSGLPISSWMSCFVNLPTTCKFHTQQRGYRSHVINTRCLCLLGTPRRDWSSEFLRDHHLRLFRCRRSDHIYHEGGGSRRLLNVLMMHTCIKNSVSEYEFGSKYKLSYGPITSVEPPPFFKIYFYLRSGFHATLCRRHTVK